ncbi:MAG: hypothetical protein AAF447_06560 [Myxococcota bacterium]
MREPLLTPDGPTPLTHLRGTAVVNSLRVMRELGLGDRYWPAVGVANEEELRSVVAQSWVPVELALIHYRAIDELVPDPEEQWAIGVRSAERLQAIYLRTLANLMRATGALTVERVLERMRSPFDRMMKGGTIAAVRTGVKDAEVLLSDMPVLDIPYFRNGLGGWIVSGLKLGAPSVRGRVLRASGRGAATYAVSWV